MFRRIIEWWLERADRVTHYRRLLLEARRRNAALCEVVLTADGNAKKIAELSTQLAATRAEFVKTERLLARRNNEIAALQRGILVALRIGGFADCRGKEALERALEQNQ